MGPIWRRSNFRSSEHSPSGQMRDESVVERVVRATNHLRCALLSGFTTYRDLGSEGMESHDARLRDCVNRGLVPGPRLFVATDALAGTGGYEARTENAAGGVRLPKISEACDGIADVRRAVRSRVAAGADVIKFYADYRRKTMRFPPAHAGDASSSIKFPPANPNPVVPLLSQDEMDEIVREAKLAELPVAAHAQSAKAALMAVHAGVTSVEHVSEATDELFREMRLRGCIFVPTLSVLQDLAGDDFPRIQRNAKKAFDAGVRLAVGGDTGAFPHGEGARELELLIEAGIPVEDVLEACTVGGWESCGGDQCGYRFGWFENGARADIIALDTDPREDKGALRKVGFVMKDGQVWKKDYIPVVMMNQLMRESSSSANNAWELL